MTVVGVQGEAALRPACRSAAADAGPRASRRRARVVVPGGPGGNGDSNRKSTLREQALADAGVQALLEVFPAEIRDVEEM